MHACLYTLCTGHWALHAEHVLIIGAVDLGACRLCVAVRLKQLLRLLLKCALCLGMLAVPEAHVLFSLPFSPCASSAVAAGVAGGRDDVLDELLAEREEVMAQRKACSEAVRALQEAVKVREEGEVAGTEVAGKVGRQGNRPGGTRWSV